MRRQNKKIFVMKKIRGHLFSIPKEAERIIDIIPDQAVRLYKTGQGRYFLTKDLEPRSFVSLAVVQRAGLNCAVPIPQKVEEKFAVNDEIFIYIHLDSEMLELIKHEPCCAACKEKISEDEPIEKYGKLFCKNCFKHVAEFDKIESLKETFATDERIREIYPDYIIASEEEIEGIFQLSSPAHESVRNIEQGLLRIEENYGVPAWDMDFMRENIFGLIGKIATDFYNFVPKNPE